MDTPRYSLDELLHTGPRSLVYRGRRLADGIPVVLKILRKERPTPTESARFRREYELLLSLTPLCPAVVRALEMDTHEGRPALVMADAGGVSLRTYAAGKPIPIEEVVEIGAAIANVLSQLHQSNVLHKDINPSNIVIHPKTRQVQIIDFGIASVLSRENPTARSLNVLEGTLVYMSPEQTGRMNRSLDYRSDLYSLGATLYELATGVPPFSSTDPVELVHSHIARTPLAPSDRNPGFPRALSAIILKLLAKTAEERYQSALGVLADLKTYRDLLRDRSTIEGFVPGLHDASDRFQIPQKLYGRDSEISVLLSSFERVSQGRGELLLVAGYSGIGKSALVSEVHKPIVARRGNFISGKFDQLQRNIPYTSLLQAFRELIRQILSEPESSLSAWRSRLLSALGQSGQAIVEVIPELSLIIGPQPPLQSMSPSESENRFQFVFKRFAQAFAQHNHPLVLFLDDLQWADTPSLKLLLHLLQDVDTKHLLVIGAYRDNEVTTGHPLLHTLDGLRKAEVQITTLLLEPLGIDHIQELVSDTLRQAPDTEPLCALLLEKTGGNPFFLGQFLRSLHDEKLIFFDATEQKWCFDLSEIKGRGFTDNVVELMAASIKKLRPQAQQVLRQAACIGNHFDLHTLLVVSEQPRMETAAALWEVIKEGLVLPLGEVFPLTQLADPDADQLFGSFKFLHDRVQQAAYHLIDASEQQGLHLQLGRLLLANTKPEALDDKLFDIVHQLNLGSEKIIDQKERYQLAALNLSATRKAKSSAAYEPALRYVNAGLRLLPSDKGWEEEYALTFSLHAEAMELEYLNTHFDRAQELADLANARAQNVLDQVKIYEIRMLFHTARNEILDTIRSALKALALLGVHLPDPQEVDNDAIGRGFANTAAIIAGRSTSELAALPEMTSPEMRAALRILITVGAPTYIASPPLFLLVVCQMINLSVQHGNSPLSPYAYVLYGLIHSGVLGDLDGAAAYGELSLTLLERFQTRELTSKVFVLVSIFIRHFKRHVRETLDMLMEALQSGMESGDLEYAGYAAIHTCIALFYIGEPLDTVSTDMARYVDLVSRTRQDFQRHFANILRQTVLNLMGNSQSPCHLVGESFNEDETLPILVQTKNTMSICTLYLCRAILHYMHADYAKAADAAKLAGDHISGVLGQQSVVVQNFYQSLSLLALCAGADEETKAKYLAIVDANQEKLKNWGTHGPANYQHKYLLVCAELAAVRGDEGSALRTYERAIEEARNQRYLQEEALANERCGEFHLAQGRTRVALLYLSEARFLYTRWGAAAKVAQLEARHPKLRAEQTEPNAFAGTHTISTLATAERASSTLDISTLMKAARTISGEIVLDRLLDSLMRILIENAGAQRGVLLMPSGGELRVFAAHTVEGAHEVEGSVYSNGIVTYVARTHESVVLNNATEQRQFHSDPYILQHKPQSLLCAPLLEQGSLIAVVYLENSLTKGAFTSDRLAVVRMLGAQAAQSLRNATLYATLEQKVIERTRELQSRNTELATALRKLRDTQRQLVSQEKLASLGALTAGIAHEIKNPLNFVNNFADNAVSLTDEIETLLDEEPVKMDVEELRLVLGDLRASVTKVREHGIRADGIINSMLLHARESAQESELASVEELLLNSQNLSFHGMRAKNSSFNVSFQRDIAANLPKIQVVSSDITRVFLNILSNALYATERKWEHAPPGYIPTIKISARSDGEFVEIHIADNGVGIPESLLPQIFHPFFTTKPPGEGTGLGLSISYDIVQSHQGELRVESREGEGADFVVRLPLPAPSGAQTEGEA